MEKEAEIQRDIRQDPWALQSDIFALNISFIAVGLWIGHIASKLVSLSKYNMGSMIPSS